MALTYKEQMDFIDRYIRGALTHDDELRMARIRATQNQQFIYFWDDYLKIDEGHELDTMRIGYNPLEHLGNAHYSNEHLFLAPSKDIIKESNRRLSRNRLVIGPVNFYLGLQQEESIAIPVITACAPNLMGTSTSDINEFTVDNEKGARSLKDDVYEMECNKIARLILGAANQHNQKRLIMPAFGVGVYINVLDEESKQRAREIMFKAFATAAVNFKITVDWVVWGQDQPPKAPKKQAHWLTPTERADWYKTRSAPNSHMNVTVQDDLLTYAQQLIKSGEQVTILNPGSDRTIGGMYTTFNPHTFEEQIAQQSDLLLLHTVFNQPLVNKFYQNFNQRKQLLAKSQHPISDVDESIKPDLGQGFFAPTPPQPVVNPTVMTSSLNDVQLQKINTLINQLQREIDSCWPYPNKDRKQIKVDALAALIKEAETTTLAAAMKKIVNDYPDMLKGTISTRTADILKDLQETNTLFASSI